jgi:hypothetical protein
LGDHTPCGVRDLSAHVRDVSARSGGNIEGDYMKAGVNEVFCEN